MVGTTTAGATVVGGTDVLVAPGPAATVVGDPGWVVGVVGATVVSVEGATVVGGTHLPESSRFGGTQGAVVGVGVVGGGVVDVGGLQFGHDVGGAVGGVGGAHGSGLNTSGR